jgi:hypothetical protein
MQETWTVENFRLALRSILSKQIGPIVCVLKGTEDPGFESLKQFEQPINRNVGMFFKVNRSKSASFGFFGPSGSWKLLFKSI